MRGHLGVIGGVLSYFTRHRTAANLLLVVLVVLGLTALPQMRTQFFPDVVNDDLTVAITWEGAGPEDVDAGIVQVLIPAFLAVEGIESSSSRSVENTARMTLTFEPGWDMTRAVDDVQQVVDRTTTLPDDAEDAVITRNAWRDRVTDVVISGPVEVTQLGQFADEFIARLFEQGVTRTTIRGVAAPQTMVEIPTASLIRHDLTMAEVATAIAAEVDTAPAGDVSGANARLRAGTAKRAADQIEQIELRVYDDGSRLLIGDVAQVYTEGADRARNYFVGDNAALSIRVDRSEQGGAVEIQHTVEEVAAALETSLPEGVKLELIRTRAESISARLNILLDNGLIGLGLVLGLLFLFLNVRTAFWVAMGIPVAMLATIALMYVSGLTINMISLFALIITTGIIVDDAIVVGEHADYRARRLGEGPQEAAENAARRMALPVFSATITTVIAFFGLTIISGRFGELITDIPFTVIVVLAASLVECFLILPNHMAHAITKSREDHWYDMPSRYVDRGFRWVRDTAFRPFMAGVIKARYPVMALAIVLLASQIALFMRGDVQWRFFSPPEQSSISGNFAMVPEATRADTVDMMREMQRAATVVGARYEEEFGLNPVVYALGEVGGNTGRGLAGVENKEADLKGSIAIELLDADLRPYSASRFVADLQDEVRSGPLTEVVSFRRHRFGPGGDSLHVEFYGAEAAQLKNAAEDLKRSVSSFAEVSALEDNLSYDKEELVVELTAQGRALGFTIDDLSRVLRNRLNGIEAATYPDGTRTAAIRVELPEDELAADFMERTLLRSAGGQFVPLADIVSTQRNAGFATVRRENGVRLIAVTGDVADDDPARAAEIARQLQEEILPRIAEEQGVSWQLAGQAEQENDFLSDALLGLILCLAGIYLTLAWVFASWTRPLVVMAIIPFGLIGTIYGHALWDVPLSMFTVVGLIGMSGIIINDSIVLVGTVDEYAENRGLFPAIIDAASNRLRPVLLTTLTTVLGLSPLLYEGSRQAEFLKPTVITLVYGLGFGLVLVLLIVPALLAMQQDVGQQIRAMRRALRARQKARGLFGVVALAVVAMAGLFAATVGAVMAQGSLPGLWLALWPGLQSAPAMPVALGLFLGVLMIVLLAIYGVSAIVWRRNLRA
ncbi:AcrB/AcrD/AcrF family transporter [Actibacterium atlanticum]|uniref:AcrB/AcrD/AcrF family transporter n=1 Tax=Actibacterium atlanticum TaxID=1461693 RepID=A0A058ZHV6_9RHOB|nr:efflux RND transporter permease subunit [Actibacterium atlanticum]KCV80805.1 AcrB/AcrD/AcrF family transporter [Actibacterium atlanticum]